MVPVGTTAMDWWYPAISLCWRCRPTARNSIQWSGFGTICAATGSPTRYFVAWPTSWTPARWRGTGSPPTPAWSARSARSPGLRLRPLHSLCLLSNRGSDKRHTRVQKFQEIRIRGKLKERSPNAVASIVANEAGLASFQADAPMLQVRDLRTSILKPASFSLSAGEALAVGGPSGAGKTLLLCAVADLDPNEGR